MTVLSKTGRLLGVFKTFIMYKKHFKTSNVLKNVYRYIDVLDVRGLVFRPLFLTIMTWLFFIFSLFEESYSSSIFQKCHIQRRRETSRRNDTRGLYCSSIKQGITHYSCCFFIIQLNLNLENLRSGGTVGIVSILLCLESRARSHSCHSQVAFTENLSYLR